MSVEFLELAIDETVHFDGMAANGIIRIPVEVEVLNTQQRSELCLLKKNNESMHQMHVDLVEYRYEISESGWSQQVVTALARYNEGVKEPLQHLMHDYLQHRAEFRRLKQKEHESMRQKFDRIPVESLVCYSNSIGVGPYVRVPLGAQNGEATLNRKILNEMRPYFTNSAVFLAKFQQARLLAEQHNEALAEKLLTLWSVSGGNRQSDSKDNQHHFDDVELIVEFDDEFQVA